jgi:hypothetical protein
MRVMNDQYARCYSVLGLQPGSNWSEVRDAYKKLIKKWHPDRFQQDNKNRRIAEERTMEITRAYKALDDYRRVHGSAPPASIPTIKPEAGIEATPKTEDMRAAATHTTASAVPSDSSKQISADVARWKILFVLVTISLLLYFLFLDTPVENSPAPAASPINATINTPQSEHGDKSAQLSTGRYFTIGSRPGDVYAVQGVPSKTENGIWYYGKSRVHFANGGVTHWENHPENPLYANTDAKLADVDKDFFQRGSTKSEVRALQGTPWRQTEHEWAYGSSRIFFSGDLVTGWEESPLNPLKIKK